MPENFHTFHLSQEDMNMDVCKDSKKINSEHNC